MSPLHIRPSVQRPVRVGTAVRALRARPCGDCVHAPHPQDVRVDVRSIRGVSFLVLLLYRMLNVRS